MVFMAGSIELVHKCPQCGVTANNSKELLAIFGLRTVPSGATNQSWCKKCRSKK